MVTGPPFRRQNSTVGAVSTKTSPVTPAAVAPPQSTFVAKRRSAASPCASELVLPDSRKRFRAARARRPRTIAAPPSATPAPTPTHPHVRCVTPTLAGGIGGRGAVFSAWLV